MQIQAVAFDIDGTLYPYSAMLLKPFLVAARHPRFFYHFARIRAALRRIRPIEDFHATQALLLAERMGSSPEQARSLLDRLVYGELVRSYRTIRPWPGVRQTLAAFRNAGLRLAVLSDFPVEQKVRYLGLDGQFECALCSEESGYLKPNPEPFLMLAQCMKLPPGKVLYVGDRYGYDVEGAAGVGMQTAYFAPRSVPQNRADITFNSYDQLADFVLPSDR